MDQLTPELWLYGILGAIFVGLGKGGLPGMGNLTVAFYALVLPDPKLSVGVLLPILSCSDIFAVRIYRKHGDTKLIMKLLPWTGIGLVLGYLLFRVLDAEDVRSLIGGLLLGLTAIHLFRLWLISRTSSPENTVPDNAFFRAIMGVLGGFATMIANAAGPVAAFYFMAMRLPKYAFIGTTAWFFGLLTSSRCLFMVELGIINWTWLPFSLAMMPFAVAATVLAPKIVKHINQQWFERLIWVFIVYAGVKLIG